MPFPHNLTEIDPLTRPDHGYLTAADACFFLGEYTARRGFAHSETNDLIINLKKPMSRKGRPEWKYKNRAIQTAARAFRAAIDDELLQNATFVPVPPSKAKNDPMYDDRITRMIRMIDHENPVDCRELIVQAESTAAAHESDERPSPHVLQDRYSIDPTQLEPAPTYIVVLDDVLTTGSHFIAAKSTLAAIFPEIPIVGYFVARRVPETIDIEAFF